MTWVNSSTLMPDSGRRPGKNVKAGASPILSILNKGKPATARPCA
jgi:hypothetical protein